MKKSLYKQGITSKMQRNDFIYDNFTNFIKSKFINVLRVLLKWNLYNILTITQLEEKLIFANRKNFSIPLEYDLYKDEEMKYKTMQINRIKENYLIFIEKLKSLYSKAYFYENSKENVPLQDDIGKNKSLKAINHNYHSLNRNNDIDVRFNLDHDSNQVNSIGQLFIKNVTSKRYKTYTEQESDYMTDYLMAASNIGHYRACIYEQINKYSKCYKKTMQSRKDKNNMDNFKSRMNRQNPIRDNRLQPGPSSYDISNNQFKNIEKLGLLKKQFKTASDNKNNAGRINYINESNIAINSSRKINISSIYHKNPSGKKAQAAQGPHNSPNTNKILLNQETPNYLNSESPKIQNDAIFNYLSPENQGRHKKNLGDDAQTSNQQLQLNNDGLFRNRADESLDDYKKIEEKLSEYDDIHKFFFNDTEDHFNSVKSKKNFLLAFNEQNEELSSIKKPNESYINLDKIDSNLLTDNPVINDITHNNLNKSAPDRLNYYDNKCVDSNLSYDYPNTPKSEASVNKLSNSLSSIKIDYLNSLLSMPEADEKYSNNDSFLNKIDKCIKYAKNIQDFYHGNEKELLKMDQKHKQLESKRYERNCHCLIESLNNFTISLYSILESVGSGRLNYFEDSLNLFIIDHEMENIDFLLNQTAYSTGVISSDNKIYKVTNILQIYFDQIKNKLDGFVNRIIHTYKGGGYIDLNLNEYKDLIPLSKNIQNSIEPTFNSISEIVKEYFDYYHNNYIDSAHNIFKELRVNINENLKNSVKALSVNKFSKEEDVLETTEYISLNIEREKYLFKLMRPNLDYGFIDDAISEIGKLMKKITICDYDMISKLSSSRSEVFSIKETILSCYKDIYDKVDKAKEVWRSGKKLEGINDYKSHYSLKHYAKELNNILYDSLKLAASNIDNHFETISNILEINALGTYVNSPSYINDPLKPEVSNTNSYKDDSDFGGQLASRKALNKFNNSNKIQDLSNNSNFFQNLERQQYNSNRLDSYNQRSTKKEYDDFSNDIKCLSKTVHYNNLSQQTSQSDDNIIRKLNFL